MLQIFQIPVLEDNFIYVLHEPKAKKTAVVDPALAQPVLQFLREKGWKLDWILNTHHHRDHVGGNLELKAATGCSIAGNKEDAKRIPGIEALLSEGDRFRMGEEEAEIFSVYGHTIGHIAYFFPQSQALFSGDVIFSIGCGKLFEGDAKQMWTSLEKLRRLPETTQIYGAHEYTLDNARYALTLEPKNSTLVKHVEWAKAQRARGLNTVPTTMAQEKSFNPFLRPESEEIQKNLGMSNKELWEIFGKIRNSKDEFDAKK